jgi:predicted nucleic acid-binding protein
LTLVRRVLAILQEPYIEIVAVDEPVGVLAADLAAQYRIRGCDAVYVALALLRNAVLITLDQEQRQRVPPTLIARTPAEELASLTDKKTR